MAKKENKITEDQLKNVNTQQGQLAEMLKSLGVLEMQKQNLAGRVNELSGEVEKTKAELEEEYGQVNIDLKTGEYTPKVEKDIAINEQKEYIMENIVENPVDAQEIAEIGYQVQNDKLYEEIKDKFDFTQYIIEAEDFGDRLPATEAAGSTQHKADLRNDSPDYENGKIYYNMQDNQFYMFSAAGPGFILITMTQE